jgi:hypothetical protein
MEVHIARGIKWHKNVVLRYIRAFINSDDSAVGVIAPSNSQCIDTNFSHTQDCRQNSCALKCHKIAIGLQRRFSLPTFVREKYTTGGEYTDVDGE